MINSLGLNIEFHHWILNSIIEFCSLPFVVEIGLCKFYHFMLSLLLYFFPLNIENFLLGVLNFYIWILHIFRYCIFHWRLNAMYCTFNIFIWWILLHFSCNKHFLLSSVFCTRNIACDYTSRVLKCLHGMYNRFKWKQIVTQSYLKNLRRPLCWSAECIGTE